MKRKEAEYEEVLRAEPFDLCGKAHAVIGMHPCEKFAALSIGTGPRLQAQDLRRVFAAL